MLGSQPAGFTSLMPSLFQAHAFLPKCFMYEHVIKYSFLEWLAMHKQPQKYLLHENLKRPLDSHTVCIQTFQSSIFMRHWNVGNGEMYEMAHLQKKQHNILPLRVTNGPGTQRPFQYWVHQNVTAITMSPASYQIRGIFLSGMLLMTNGIFHTSYQSRNWSQTHHLTQIYSALLFQFILWGNFIDFCFVLLISYSRNVLYFFKCPIDTLFLLFCLVGENRFLSKRIPVKFVSA